MIRFTGSASAYDILTGIVPELLGHTEFTMTCLAVVDVETTGLNPYGHDRVVELAAVVIGLDGTVLREFVTLLNPERDIGPTRIHGLSTRDILAAPRFEEIAGLFFEFLGGCVAVAGHNVSFDHSFLTAETARLGHLFPDGPKLCTMRLVRGGTLSRVCSAYEIAFDGEVHSALHDARATARLLTALLKDGPSEASEISSWLPIDWPSIPVSSVRPLTRDHSRRSPAEPPTYIQKLLKRAQPDIPSFDQHSAIDAYSSLLSQVLEDRFVDDKEGEALVDLATRWRISAEQVQAIHREFLLGLEIEALSDGVVTDAERRDLHQVALLLGLDPASIEQILALASKRLEGVQIPAQTSAWALDFNDFAGKQVCFTGECQCLFGGELITRSMAAKLASHRGMIVSDSVTKKLDLLVVSDPLSQSGKAKKARRLGIRIVYESVFWKALDLEVG